jgi:hypothetical protein
VASSDVSHDCCHTMIFLLDFLMNYYSGAS